jgi:hypothetical protein
LCCVHADRETSDGGGACNAQPASVAEHILLVSALNVAAAVWLHGLLCRGLTIEEFPLLLLTVGEYIAARRNLGGFSKADALAGEQLQQV